MSSVPSRRPDPLAHTDTRQETNLLDFTQSICRLFSRRMSQQGVDHTLDIDPAASFRMVRDAAGELLMRMIEDALRAMPDGGQLDIVAVVGPEGLEIEIADSGHEMDFDLRIHGRSDVVSRAGQRSTVTDGMRLETRRCPQGGTARTLCIPWADARAAA